MIAVFPVIQVQVNPEFPINITKAMPPPFAPFHVITHFIFLALVKSWDTPFIGKRALEALEQHVVGVTRSAMRYAPYCSIIQSSGMGKSRLLDEFSKNHFLIPINLRKRDAGGTYNPIILTLWPFTPVLQVFLPPTMPFAIFLQAGRTKKMKEL